MPRWLLIVLLVLNVMVLLGQIWPAGAPPFARAMNLTFLAASLASFAWLLGRSKSRRG
jgi:hypothetical protein